MGNVPYSIQVSYDTSFKIGPQEGIAEVLLSTPIEADPYAAVMVKVLLNPQPRVAQGSVSCPVAQQVPGYWETVLGIDTSTGGVGTVSCGNLKGDSSLQALVPVYSTTGKPGEIYVYDHIREVIVLIADHHVFLWADIHQRFPFFVRFETASSAVPVTCPLSTYDHTKSLSACGTPSPSLRFFPPEKAITRFASLIPARAGFPRNARYLPG